MDVCFWRNGKSCVAVGVWGMTTLVRTNESGMDLPKIMSLISNTSLIKMITWLVNSISLCFVCSIIVIHRGWGDVFVLAVGKWGLLVLTYFSHSLFLGACASSYELAHKTCSIQFPFMSNFLKKGSFPNTQHISW